MSQAYETLPGGTVVFTDKNHPLVTDSLLLARFCQPKPRFSVCELGAGCGVILLSLVDAGLTGPAIGVELQSEACAMLEKAAQAGGLQTVQVVNTNLCHFTTAQPVDMVVANPPYFTSGLQAGQPQRALARHQGAATLAQFCAAAARSLKDGGRFCLCYPATQLALLMAELQTHRLAPKRMQLVRKTAASQPWLVLLDARKAGGVGLSILPDILLNPGDALHY